MAVRDEIMRGIIARGAQLREKPMPKVYSELEYCRWTKR
jgi:hypothetical protein